LGLPDSIVRPRASRASFGRPVAADFTSPEELLWSDAGPPVRLPDDEVLDELLPTELVLRRAEERYPVVSSVTTLGNPGTLREAFTQAAQRRFRVALDSTEPQILARLDQPFGTDNLSQCFYSTPGLRHVLLPLWKSGFLYGDPTSWNSFCSAYFPASILQDLLH
jgi:hypothetical protein